jgi:chaperonin GroEL
MTDKNWNSENVDGEALTACVLRGQLQVVAVNAPGFSNNRKFGDLTILAEEMVFTDQLDVKLERATPNLLGSAGSMTLIKEDTNIFQLRRWEGWY